MDNIIEELINYFEEAKKYKYNDLLMKSDIKRILEPYVERITKEAEENVYQDAYNEGYNDGYDEGYEEGYELEEE